ncbi:alpha/beta fold hydrolase [Alkaliphilus hydrothermalis]|uniref:Pimeloyl-ACP methyl ester carboxylesterase n=1 Tax=Alkaliphilus hydrothermalis TaxID=1482730 RepID=A0ABS2NLU5_9FIRM|nr:alpha/beta fold hydrolase [Alkaliphilus hydrothermalis]MBM7613554.1 pimeloyl-ACP methyl ester carboxylesterase [Alkaliphilus hydrothermalis]
MKHKNILIHGYNKTSSDMKVLKDNLEKLGHGCIILDLPLTYHKLEHGTMLLEEMLSDLIKDLKEGEKLNLVGHSTGGLVIRHLLSFTSHRKYIDKCILVATPNRGSDFANLVGRIFRIAFKKYKTLKSIQSCELKRLGLGDECNDIDIAAIAGNNNNLFFGNLLREENDGRVTVKSVKIEGLKDFILLPYGHKDIHYQPVTAELIDSFLRTGKFKVD